MSRCSPDPAWVHTDVVVSDGERDFYQVGIFQTHRIQSGQPYFTFRGSGRHPTLPVTVVTAVLSDWTVCVDVLAVCGRVCECLGLGFGCQRGLTRSGMFRHARGGCRGNSFFLKESSQAWGVDVGILGRLRRRGEINRGRKIEREPAVWNGCCRY
ncbi:hypothetical protein DPX16_20694 [Anabarilius grahami]|uniref:Uncharacterized protein n=1 Tax=Anabarilius grahami TaxID=495550 RepID=A0A3N0YL98_ANAGA|nr:hypothetical protein DPX16_20694 [Anabarilius grahami]